MTGWWAAAFIAQWLLVLVLATVVVALARQVGTLHLRLGPRGALEVDSEGPALGEAPPPRCRGSMTTATASWSVARAPPVWCCSRRRRARSAGRWRRGSARLPLRRGSRPWSLHDPDLERVYDVPGTPFLLVMDRRESSGRRGR